ncbi:hypothetical protein [Clostridium saudiense]|uniref:hypothetical protein n=1 Tax=Clostridium saudiense TaxID=1414720 RepID=UPI000821941E|nr:hypothetical protein [Clostridium saudiense]SCJ56080.1 Uncharacterised protein [uncultured Clostridium sp.]
MQNIIDYLEEILIILGFLTFITFGFMLSVKLGVLFISVSLFILAFLTIIYKKKVGEDNEGK